MKTLNLKDLGEVDLSLIKNFYELKNKEKNINEEILIQNVYLGIHKQKKPEINFIEKINQNQNNHDSLLVLNKDNRNNETKENVKINRNNSPKKLFIKRDEEVEVENKKIININQTTTVIIKKPEIIKEIIMNNKIEKDNDKFIPSFIKHKRKNI